MDDINDFIFSNQHHPLEQFGFGDDLESNNGAEWLSLYDEMGQLECRLCANPELWPLLDHRKLFGNIEGLLSDFSPLYPGATWILFAFTDRRQSSPDAPLRGDGFVLFCQWRHQRDIAGDGTHDPRLPRMLTQLADKVKEQFMKSDITRDRHPENYWLWLYDRHFGPAYDIQGNLTKTTLLSSLEALTDDKDARDLNDESIPDDKTPSNRTPTTSTNVIDSAWGALSCGLYLAVNGRLPDSEWPFSSVAYDFVHEAVAGVGLLERKMSAALDFKPTRFWVSPAQGRKGGVAEQAKVDLQNKLKLRLKDLETQRANYNDKDPLYGFFDNRMQIVRKRLNALDEMKIVSPRQTRNPVEIAREIALGEKSRLKYLFLFLMVLAVFLSVFLVDSTRTVKNYYADYVDSFGLPEGIFPLAKSDIKGRHIYYRFEYKGFQHGKSPHADSSDWTVWRCFGLRRKLIRVVQANPYGYPIKQDQTTEYNNRSVREYNERPAIQEFKYVDKGDDANRLAEIHYGIFNGKNCKPQLEKRIELYTDNEINEEGHINNLIQFYSGMGQLRHSFSPASDTIYTFRNEPAKSSIMRYIVTRNESGRIVRLLFYNALGKNVPNGDGLYGFSYEYDSLGRQISQKYLIFNGNSYEIGSNKKGVTAKKYYYRGSTLYKVEYTDKNNHPVTSSHGWMKCESIFDKKDNCKEIWYFDQNGKKTFCNDRFAGIKYKYDKYGNIISNIYCNTDGHPTFCKDGYAEIRYDEFDKFGNPQKISYLGDNGEPTLHKKGSYAIMRVKYDNSKGNVLMASFYGIDGKPILTRYGFAKIIFDYNEQGNLTGLTNFDKDDKPVLRREGFAKVIIKYSKDGKKEMVAYYDKNDKLKLIEDGYAEIHFNYDDFGNRKQDMFYDENGKEKGNLVLCKDGYAMSEFNYNEHGNLETESVFGIDNKPILCKNGFFKIQYEYDNSMNIVKKIYYDTDGKKLSLHKDGYSIVNYIYDAYGNLREESYCGIDKKLILCKNRYSKVYYEYNEHGKIDKCTYWVGEQPVLCKDGYAGIELEYAENNIDIKRRKYLDRHSRPINNIFGVAEEVMEYDKQGNLKKISFYNKDGKKVIHQNTGFAEVEYEFDKRGNIIKEVYFGRYGKINLKNGGYAEVRKEYDERGNVINESYYNQEGKKVLHNDGYAEVRKEYDEHGNLIHECFFNLDNEKASCHTSDYGAFYSEINYEYNEQGNIIKKSYNTILSLYDEIRWTYDKRGNKTEESYFKSGKLTINTYLGYAKYTLKYDDYGNITKESYFDENEKLTLKSRFDDTSYAVRVCVYDKNGNLTSEMFFDKDNRPILKDGIIKKSSYDEFGNKIEDAYYNYNDDKLTINKEEGYAKKKYSYDKFGYKNEVAFYNDRDELIMCNDGYAKQIMHYYENGDLQSEEYYGTDNKPTIGDGGFAKKMIEYYYSKNLKESIPITRYYDVFDIEIENFDLSILTADLSHNSITEKLGIQTGDVWCKLGTYDILKSSSLDSDDINNIIKELKDTTKELIVARKVNNEYKILKFNFPIGIIDINYTREYLPDLGLLQKNYKTYINEKK